MRTRVILFAIVVLIGACAKKQDTGPFLATRDGLKRITILSTNDIHGGIEPTLSRDGRPYGGLALFAGVTSAIRKGLHDKYRDDAGVFVVDAGDQFQGTLISNYDEGQLIFKAMNEVGYDVAIPGNHDYDFGPIGWLVDAADPKKPEQFREALLRLKKEANFPLVSGNTFYKNSLVDGDGKHVEVANTHCKPKADGAAIDWTKASRPEFLTPYVVKESAGLKVAFIGIDHPNTPETTTAVNVSDLCFGDEYEHYVRLRKELEGKANIFILVMHNGDANTDKSGTKLVERLTATAGMVDAVVSGHTHFTYNENVGGVPLIQSGHGGTSFGRIDFVWDPGKKKLLTDKTKSYAGVKLYPDGCDTRAGAGDFCSADAEKKIKYEGVAVTPNANVQKLVADARSTVNPIAKRKLGRALKELTRDRIAESSLADALTDIFRKTAEADVATLNTGGLRENIRKGDITYEDLFRVIPFNNHGLVVGPMPTENMLKLIRQSIKTCGIFGALMQSGLKVSYRRDCSDSVKAGGIDEHATLVKVETIDGKLVYDEDHGVAATAPASFNVATLDFLARGGENYEGFKDVPQKSDLGILREALTDKFVKAPVTLDGKLDDRWKNLTPERGHSHSPEE